MRRKTGDASQPQDLAEVLRHFLDEAGRLRAFPAKRSMKLHALAYLAERFVPDRTYAEREVNELLNQCFLSL